MIAAQENCLDRKTLRDLLEGRLPEDRFALAWEHVESCPICTATLEDSHSDANKNSLAWLRQAAVLDCNAAESAQRFDHESQCQALLGDLLVRSGMAEISITPVDAQGWDRVPKESLGPYRLIKAIGSGGMGAVYLAEHQRLKRQVAIKLLPREKLLRSGWLDRFNREMTSIAALEHANVVRALDAGDEDDWHYLVMEYLEGLDLSQICRRVPDVSVGAACELIRQAALGLAAIHAVGMVHRDVKPSNIFLARGGTVKLLDLGLVLSGESPLSADERLTTVGHLMGTLPYMAREQLNDARNVDHRTDLYSLGASLYRILTGKPPYGSAENLARTISQISTLDCPSIAEIRTDLPEELVAVVTKLLSHDPEQRPQSAQQVAESLLPFADPAAARELLRVAQNTPPLDSSMVSTHRSIEIASIKQPPRRWWPWIAMGLLFPLLFGAGILVNVVTDQGTLTIQSDLPGVEVVVKQGEKAVKTLRVEQQAESVVLRSGRYIIELTGVAADGFEISDRDVVIVRGDQQLVYVSRRELDGDGRADTIPRADGGTFRTEFSRKAKPDERLFQNQPLAHWMQVLIRDQDNQTLGQAMQAMVLLAETDAEKLAAARQFLIPARRLGGLVSTGGGTRPPDPSPSDLSEWFMTDLMRWYPNLFPQAGLEAIEEELGNTNGTEAGWLACMWLLFEFGTGYEAIGTPILARSYYGELVQTSEGRQRLEGLQDLLRGRSEEFFASARLLPEESRRRHHLRTAADMGIMHRLMILKLLDGVPESDPQIDDWAMRRLKEASAAVDELNGTQGGQMGQPRYSLLRADAALDIYVAVGAPSEYVAPLVFGLLSPNDDDEAQTTLQIFDVIADEHPEQTALAVGKFLQFQKGIQLNGMMFGGHHPNVVNNERLPFWRTEPIRHAAHFFAAHYPDPFAALQLFGSFVESQDANATDSDINNSIIDELLIRAILETELDATSRSSAKFAYVAYAYNELQRWIDDERRNSEVHGRARAMLVKAGASRGDNGSGTVMIPSKKNPLGLSRVAAMADLDAREWNDGTFYANLNRLTRQYPALWFPEIADQMRESDLSARELSQYLLPGLLIDLAWSSRSSDSELKDYFDLPTSRPSLLSMSDSLELLLASQPSAADGSPTPLLQSELQSYIAIQRLLGESIREKQSVLTLLQSLVAWAADRPNEGGMPLDLLIALSQATSPAEIPLPAVWSAASRTGQETNIDVELKREFVRNVSAADRALFTDYFLSHLQRIVDRADDGWIDSFLANNSLSPGSLWWIIVDFLRSDPVPQSRTEDIVRKMLQHFDGRDESLFSHSRHELKSLLAPR